MASLNPYAPRFLPEELDKPPPAPSLSISSPPFCADGYPYCSDSTLFQQPVCPNFPVGFYPSELLHPAPGFPSGFVHHDPPLYCDHYFYYHGRMGIESIDYSGVPFPWSSCTFVQAAVVPHLAPSYPVTLPPWPAFPVSGEGLLPPPPAACYAPPPAPPEIQVVSPPTPLCQGGGGKPPQKAVARMKRVKVAPPRWRVKVQNCNGAVGGAAGGSGGCGSNTTTGGEVHRGPKRGSQYNIALRSAFSVPRLRRFQRSPPRMSGHLQFKAEAEVPKGGGGGGGGGAPPSTDDIDPRATVMIRNIPNKLRKMELLRILDAHCVAENKKLEGSPSTLLSRFNFLYLPIDFVTCCNLGYAFVNFTSAAAARRLYRAYHRFSWRSLGSGKVCEVTYARIQGLPALLKHFRDITFRCSSPDVLPLHFAPYRDGVHQGQCRSIGKLIPPHVAA